MLTLPQEHSVAITDTCRMNTEELLLRWSARVAMVLYVLALVSRIAMRRRVVSRALWTAGCGVYLFHVACAFQFVHHWSHAAAYAATARQTAELIGLDWGGGLYANYVFTLVWVGDVVWWWFFPARYLARSRAAGWMVHGFMGFIAFNATVVFAPGVSRGIGIAGCLLLAIVWFWTRASLSGSPVNVTDEKH
jgi:hypothetical protein